MRKALLVFAIGLSFTAHAQTSGTKIEKRFETFSGSSANSASLVTGLRKGGDVTLTGSGETATFTSPTKPMGYGNITRALDLAQRRLAASGIADPTPKEIQAALMGGTVTGPNGQVTYEGVLQMRADGMGWGQIAHAVGVHPGLGKPVAAKSTPSFPAAASGHTNAIVTAGGGSPLSHANGNGRALGRSDTTSAASSASAAGASAGGNGAARSAAGGSNGNAFGRAK